MSSFGWRVAIIIGAVPAFGCHPADVGNVGVRVQFPLSIAAIPSTTQTIQVVVKRDGQVFGRISLGRSAPTGMVRSIPAGDVDVLAVAFDAACVPLAVATGTATIVPATTSRAELVLGAIDPLVVSLMATLMPLACPTPTPSYRSPTVSSSPLSASTTTATPSPSGSPQVAGGVSVVDGNDLTVTPVGAP